MIDRDTIARLGLTVAQLATLAGVHRSVAYRYLAGEAEPPASLVALLSVWPEISEESRKYLLAGKHLMVKPT
ncbi:MAG: helix-turn-helix domain-containing protein [Magnetospirillum sp.]|nr:helix-turn-helix domain-containing protein [Magnetospirillum sp.]